MADYSEKQIIPFVNKAIKLYLQFYLVLATYPFVVWVGIKFFFFFFVQLQDSTNQNYLKTKVFNPLNAGLNFACCFVWM